MMIRIAKILIKKILMKNISREIVLEKYKSFSRSIENFCFLSFPSSLLKEKKLGAIEIHFPKYNKHFSDRVFSVFKIGNSFLKYKRFCKLGARKFHFQKYKKNFFLRKLVFY